MLLSLFRRRGLQARAFHTARLACMAEAAPEAAPEKDPAEFKWHHVMTPYTSPEIGNRLRAIEQSLQALKAELTGAPERIDPIDWSEWEEKIEDKAAVEQIKAGYENFKPEEDKGVDIEAITADIDKSLQSFGKGEWLVVERLSKLKAQLERAKRVKVEIHDWKFHDWLDNFPGLAEESRQEWMEGYQLPHEGLERLAESDIREWIRIVRTGGKLVVDDADIPARVGDWDYVEELTKVEDAAKQHLSLEDPRVKEFLEEIRKEKLRVTKVETPPAAIQEEH